MRFEMVLSMNTFLVCTTLLAYPYPSGRAQGSQTEGWHAVEAAARSIAGRLDLFTRFPNRLFSRLDRRP